VTNGPHMFQDPCENPIELNERAFQRLNRAIDWWDLKPYWDFKKHKIIGFGITCKTSKTTPDISYFYDPTVAGCITKALEKYS